MTDTLTDHDASGPTAPADAEDDGGGHGQITRRKFVPLDDIADTLAISKTQAYALVRSGQLRAIQVGGRGQWRIDLNELENYIQRAYDQTAREIAEAGSGTEEAA